MRGSLAVAALAVTLALGSVALPEAFAAAQIADAGSHATGCTGPPQILSIAFLGIIDGGPSFSLTFAGEGGAGNAGIIVDSRYSAYYFAYATGPDGNPATFNASPLLFGQSSFAPETTHSAVVVVNNQCGQTTSGPYSFTMPSGSASTPPVPPTNQPPVCWPYLMIDSRGSGESLGSPSPPGADFLSWFRQQHPSQKVEVVTNPYPAVGGILTMIEAGLKTSSSYANSVIAGTSWLTQEVSQTRTKCQTTKMILVGYSQGAQVTGNVYQSVGPRQILGVVLFGDPLFNSHDATADQGNFQKGLDGALGTRKLFATATAGRVLSYCHLHDPVCQGKSQVTYLTMYHDNYAATNEPRNAAQALSRFTTTP